MIDAPADGNQRGAPGRKSADGIVVTRSWFEYAPGLELTCKLRKRNIRFGLKEMKADSHRVGLDSATGGVRLPLDDAPAFKRAGGHIYSGLTSAPTASSRIFCSRGSLSNWISSPAGTIVEMPLFACPVPLMVVTNCKLKFSSS